MMRGKRLAALVALSVPLLGGCMTFPEVGAPPKVQARQEIPLPDPPQRPLTVGIYSCIDTSGQRRPDQVVQELSTAVPMDCTPYLTEAVRSLRPGYVFLVERQHVDDLLRERQLATLALNNAAEIDKQAAAHKLATLRVAEVLLVGQVVAYDRSVHQLAAGAAVNGIGASGAYVTDIVTFSVRAVAVQTGEVIGQVTVTKSVTSLKIGSHFAKIYGTDAVDLEAGGAGNEPVGIALGSAVRSAVIQLVHQGVKDGWWA